MYRPSYSCITLMCCALLTDRSTNNDGGTMGRWHGSRGNVWNHCRGIGQWECGSGKGIRPKRERGMGYPEPEYPTVIFLKL